VHRVHPSAAAIDAAGLTGRLSAVQPLRRSRLYRLSTWRGGSGRQHERQEEPRRGREGVVRAALLEGLGHQRVGLDKLPDDIESRLRLRLVASTGTPYLSYYGAGGNRAEETVVDGFGFWTAEHDLRLPDGVTFFYPYTTTLLEIRLNREPTAAVDPRDPAYTMELVRFD